MNVCIDTFVFYCGISNFPFSSVVPFSVIADSFSLLKAVGKTINCGLCTGNTPVFFYFVGEKDWFPFICFSSSLILFSFICCQQFCSLRCSVWRGSSVKPVRAEDGGCRFLCPSAGQRHSERCRQPLPAVPACSCSSSVLFMSKNHIFCFLVTCNNFSYYKFVWTMLSFSSWDCCPFVLM